MSREVSDGVEGATSRPETAGYPRTGADGPARGLSTDGRERIDPERFGRDRGW